MIGTYLRCIQARLRGQLELGPESIDLVTDDVQAFATCPQIFYGLFCDSTNALHQDENNASFMASIALTVSVKIDSGFAGAGEIWRGLVEPFDFYGRMPGLAIIFRDAARQAAMDANALAVASRETPWQIAEQPTLASLGVPPTPRTARWWVDDGQHLMGFSATVRMTGAKFIMGNPDRSGGGDL
jgi:hypothetical protein